MTNHLSKIRKLYETIYWRCSDAGLVSLPDARTITSIRDHELYEIIRPHLHAHGHELLGWQKKRTDLLREIRNRLRDDFVSVQKYFYDACADLMSYSEFEKEKTAFLKDWFCECQPTTKKHPPDKEQLTAIGAVNGHIQIVARAGSGKTSTLVNRAFFLLKHCRVAPSEILILAFNTKAALEIKERLLVLLYVNAQAEIEKEKKKKRKNWREEGESVINKIAEKSNVTLPYVMTFHALALAVVSPEEEVLSDDPSRNDRALSRLLQSVIHEFLQKPDFKEKICSVMLAYFRADWEKIIYGGYDLSKEDFLPFRRSLPGVGLDGKRYKSHGEKVIANFLFEHGLEYKYEKNWWWWDGTNYRPDFTTYYPQSQNSGVIIEYFGLAGDPDYDKMSEQKHRYWKKKDGWTLIEFKRRDIALSSTAEFHSHLKSCLEKHGVQCARLSETEIYERAQENATYNFTEAMTNFIGKCRQRVWSPSELREKIDMHAPLSSSESVEGDFLELAYELYDAYLKRLNEHNKEDFNGVMQRAANAIDLGKTVFTRRKSGVVDLAALRYICIDEFQDFSDLFYRLLKAIRKNNPDVDLFCVGDDWQAINGFAGADLRFFRDFDKYIGGNSPIHISTNYRSRRAIVSAGNVVMQGRGRPAKAHNSGTSRVLYANIDSFAPSTVEEDRHRNDRVTPATLRVVNRALRRGLNVVLLSRTNSVPWSQNCSVQDYCNKIRRFFPQSEDRIAGETVHRYKGLEKDVVIVLDATIRNWPLIHPNWVFSRVFGDSPEKIEEEERRLFYVALTRAVQGLVIFKYADAESLFLKELISKSVVNEIDWDEFPALCSETGKLVVEVRNRGRGSNPTLVSKGPLSKEKYQWQRRIKGYRKLVQSEGFEIATIKSEEWTRGAKEIDVHIYDETEKNLIAHYQVDGGNWHTVVDNLGEYL